MKPFKITFIHLNRIYTALVRKIKGNPVQYVVSDVSPFIFKLPKQLVFLSSPEQDQLVYQSFDVKLHAIIQAIGEAIFMSCNTNKIAIHH